MNIFTIENMKYITPGDGIVLSVIGVCILIFLKYRVPWVKKELADKTSAKDCFTLRTTCQALTLNKLDNINTLMTTKLDSLQTLMISKIDGLDEKFTSQVEDVKELIRRTNGGH